MFCEFCSGYGSALRCRKLALRRFAPFMGKCLQFIAILSCLRQNTFAKRNLALQMIRNRWGPGYGVIFQIFSLAMGSYNQMLPCSRVLPLDSLRHMRTEPPNRVALSQNISRRDNATRNCKNYEIFETMEG